MGRPTNTDARRAQIVEALMQVMAVHGFDGASIRLIAEAADLTPGLVHYHFKTKHDILLELMNHLAALLEERLNDALAHKATPREHLHAFLRALLSLDPVDRPDPAAVACWIAVGAQAVRAPALAARLQVALAGLQRTLAALLRDALADAGRSTQGAEADAWVLIAAIQGSFGLAGAGVAPRGFAADGLIRAADALIDAAPPAGKGA
ncbi:MAG: TetR/AcrR family transcriptional regulator [Alphaproteobacteria bacterium]|nr:TetR/AcrR family transcriptional regulator [Alphaproteobacteria bacterium]